MRAGQGMAAKGLQRRSALLTATPTKLSIGCANRLSNTRLK